METKEKKQVVSAINRAGNILITVGVSPNVDALSALLGLTLILGKLDKHATAVFSGTVPPAISFLEPGKTFENTVDGLRDFIIALNKEKADHLRYKLDGDVVKIFITPYKNTIIRSDDLEFSQGDFNVELVVALGSVNKADLDGAVASHGRILHDATTVTMTVGNIASELGETDWHAAGASSLCEMVVSLARDLGDNLIDEHVATALLTGIVAETERFSNNRTTSDVMKTAANLMSLGANQQLVALQLEPREEEVVTVPLPPEKAAVASEEGADNGTGSMQIDHKPSAEVLASIMDDDDSSLQAQLDKLIPPAADLSSLAPPAPAEAPAPVPEPVTHPTPEAEAAPQPEPQPEPAEPRIVAKATDFDDGREPLGEPSMGGTLNATTEQAEEDNRTAEEDARNHVILSHDVPVLTPPVVVPVVLAPEPIADAPVAQAPLDAADSLASLGYSAHSAPTLADLDARTGHDAGYAPAQSAPAAKPPLDVDDARAAVATALDSAFTPANNPVQGIGSQQLGPDLRDAPVLQAPAATALDLPPLPPLPPLPGQEGGLPPLPPLPEMGELDAHVSERPQADGAPAPSTHDWQDHTVEPATANDPGQFRIPGQK